MQSAHLAGVVEVDRAAFRPFYESLFRIVGAADSPFDFFSFFDSIHLFCGDAETIASADTGIESFMRAKSAMSVNGPRSAKAQRDTLNGGIPQLFETTYWLRCSVRHALRQTHAAYACSKN